MKVLGGEKNMTDVSEVADGIYQIETDEVSTFGTLGLPRSNTGYFIIGEQTALVETGPAVAVPAILDAICQLGHNPSRLS
jgi:hypothetical protein